MARPAGQFNQQKERCYTVLKVLAGYTGTCTSSNLFLSKHLGVCLKQVSTYLKVLREEDRIEIETSSLETNSNTKSRYRKRSIKIRQPQTQMSISVDNPLDDIFREHEESLEAYRVAFSEEMAQTGGSDLCDSLYHRIMRLEGLE